MAREHLLPIDRGWAWVIVSVTSAIWAIQAGGFKCQGLFLVEMKERFPEVSEAKLLWVFGASSVITCASGVFNSWLITTTSYRTTAFIGCCIVVLGWVGTAYANQIWMLYITFSIFYGMGNGMIGLVALLGTTPYFVKRRAMAVGMTAAGSGVGTIALPNLIRFLFDNYNYSGAMLLYGGFTMNFLILICLLRPMSFYERRKTRQLQREEEEEYIMNIQSKPPPKLIVTDFDNEDKLLQVVYSASQCSLLNLENQASEREKDEPSDNMLNQSSKDKGRSASFHVPKARVIHTGKLFSSASGIDKHNTTVFTSTIPRHRSTSSSFQSVGDLSVAVVVQETQIKSKGRTKFDWAVLLKPKIIMIGVAIFFFQCGGGVTYQCIAPLGKSNGVDKETIALVLTIAGAVEIPCRVLNGWVADQKFFTALTQLTMILGTVATSSLICATVSGLEGIVVMIMTMSCVGTSVYNLLPIVCVELVGEEKAAGALGINWAYQSLSFAITTPIAGYLFSTFGQWESVFYYISTVEWTAFLILLPYCVYYNCFKRDTGCCHRS